MAAAIAEQVDMGTGEPQEVEAEMVDVPPLAPRIGSTAPTESRKARERRRKAEGMEASRYATPGGATLHPDRAKLIERPTTPPQPPVC